MASVRVRVEDFEDGVLPLVCVATGAPSDRLYKVEATSRAPGWVWLFLLGFPWGLFLIPLVAGATRKRTWGFVPYTDAHQTVVSRRVRMAAWCAVSGAAALVLGFLLLLQQGYGVLGFGFAVVGGVAALVGGFLGLNPPGSAGLTLDRTGRWVELDPVSPAFARAYEDQEARRRAARRAESASASARRGGDDPQLR